jgi:hypothetical protein
MLIFYLARSLIHSNSNSDLCEIWHRRMAHLHHGDLRVLRDCYQGTIFQYRAPGCVQGVYTREVHQVFFSKQ